MTRIKNLRRDDACGNPETELANEILSLYVDNHDEIADGTRIVVLVASGNNDGRIGCAFEGYDEDERLAADLQLLAQAVDLGVPGGGE